LAKNVVIVESPAKAKTIERYLGKDYRVSASMGHVRDLPQKKLGVEIEDDFRPTYTILPGKKKVIDGLKKLAAGAETVYMATDLDREGEAIAWHLCEALGLDPATTRRVTFNEITKAAIQAAFAQPATIDMNKVAAQEARRILDRLVGYKLSPLLWKKVAKGLSAGRVQSVAVRLVVEREQEIRAFGPEEYWTIGAILSRHGDAKTFRATLAEVNGAKFRPSTGEEAHRVGEALRRAAYRVLDTGTHRIEDKAPPPFITSQLQQAASAQLGFGAKRTMSIAQELYQGVELGPEGSVALITYMRTDSYHIAPAAIAAVRELIGKIFGPQYVPDQPMYYRSRGRAQEAHEAIRPTDVTRTPESVAQYLDRDAARLYELIWRRFVASQMRPAQWDVTEANIEGAAGSVRGLFKARGRVLVYDGHTKVTGLRLGEGEQELPALAANDPLDLKELEEAQHFTQPPPRYTEATLVKKLEGLGIGRPSTYASIVSTIQDRGYVKQQPNIFLRCENHPKCQYTVPCDVNGKPMPRNGDGKACRSCHAPLVQKAGKRCLYATDLGEVVTGKLVQHFQKVMDYAFTSHMEEELDDVEEAKTKWLQVVREFWEPFSEALKQAGEEMESTKHQAVEDAGPCPQCQAPLVKRWSKRGPFLGCSKYPDCTYTRPLEGEERPQPKPTEHKCDKCGGTMIMRYNRRGEPFLGCENYPKCRSTLPCDKDGNPIRPQLTGEKCEKCGADMVIKNSRRGPFMACSAYPKCRNAKSIGGKKKAEGEAAEGEAGEGAAKPKRAPRRRSSAVATDRDCPDCGAKMLIRSGRRGPFLGCSGYPKCKHTENLPADLAVPEGM
jgi:DNA topoisomerase-1